VVRCTETCLDHNNVSVLITWCLWTSEHPLDFCLNFYFWLHVIYPYMHKYESILKCAIHEVPSAIWCMKQEHLNHVNPLQAILLNYPYLFYLVSNLIKQYRVYNMKFMALIMPFDFMQVLNNIKKHPTKIEHFSKHNFFLQFV
jgi:hypothetical protein